MRCQCCNEELSDYESTMRNGETNDYLDICGKCLKDINMDMKIIARADLRHENDEVGTDLALQNTLENDYYNLSNNSLKDDYEG